jgi:hypothetical protein
MKFKLFLFVLIVVLTVQKNIYSQNIDINNITINQKAEGYRGIWYMNQPSNDEYVFKYSGGLGTYCAKHQPFAVYSKEVNKTFFCYGGTTEKDNRQLLHMVSFFDHTHKQIPKPTILLDKQTSDAHDNPVISIDDKGYLWIFSTSHGTSRLSYIHKSVLPYNIEEFELIHARKIEKNQQVPMRNFSYMQSWFVSGKGFLNFFTRYNYPVKRTNCFVSSDDGIHWSEWKRIAAIEEGHYQISAVNKTKAAAAFNYHPHQKGLNWRTNLYYVESLDGGKSWQTIDGNKINIPLTKSQNSALVFNYQIERLNVYLKDIRLDKNNNPVILFITSKGYECGPKNNPRIWNIAKWLGGEWQIYPITTSDNNYDMGSLYLDFDPLWYIVAPLQTGAQPYNPGGEMVLLESSDKGKTWKKVKQLTKNSKYNHTYARRPVNVHPDFFAIWADGHGRKESESNLYFCDINGNVYLLPRKMKTEFAEPVILK